MNNNNNNTDNNHHIGHRDRAFNNILNKDVNSISNVEILEIILMISIPRKNVKPIVHNLIKKYKNIYMILGTEASQLKLIDNIGEKTVRFLKILLLLLQFISKEKVYNKEQFFDLEEVIAYCKWKMSYLNKEELRVLYLNVKNQLIMDEVNNYGTINSVSINNREIVKQSLLLGATGIILCHNHPSGDPTPSKEDINITHQLKKILDMLEIKLIDHIIIGGLNSFSMKKNQIF
jgi:DNA repair protein RadC